MSITDKLFSFQGRLRRRDWWLFSILIAIIGAVLNGVGTSLVGGTVTPAMIMNGSADLAGAMTKSIEVQTVVSLLLLWPGLAVGYKRLHDRNKTGTILAGLAVLSFVYRGVVFFTMGSRVGAVGPAAVMPGPLALALGCLVLIVAIWMLIELGFLDGTQGPNKYGPSPKGLGAEEVGFST